MKQLIFNKELYLGAPTIRQFTIDKILFSGNSLHMKNENKDCVANVFSAVATTGERFLLSVLFTANDEEEKIIDLFDKSIINSDVTFMVDFNLVSTALPINNGLGQYIYYFTNYQDTFELLLDYKNHLFVQNIMNKSNATGAGIAGRCPTNEDNYIYSFDFEKPIELSELKHDIKAVNVEQFSHVINEETKETVNFIDITIIFEIEGIDRLLLFKSVIKKEDNTAFNIVIDNNFYFDNMNNLIKYYEDKNEKDFVAFIVDESTIATICITDEKQIKDVVFTFAKEDGKMDIYKSSADAYNKMISNMISEVLGA